MNFCAFEICIIIYLTRVLFYFVLIGKYDHFYNNKLPLNFNKLLLNAICSKSLQYEGRFMCFMSNTCAEWYTYLCTRNV